MGKIVNIGSRQRFDFHDENFQGVQINAILESAAVNTAIGGTVDWDKVYVDILLEQGGLPSRTIWSGKLKALAMATAKHSKYFMDCAVGEYYTLNTEDADEAEQGISSVVVPFGTVINLDSGDKLQVDVKVDSAFTSGLTSVSASASYIEVEMVDGIGPQYFVPKLAVYTIQGSEANPKWSLGDNVQEVDFLWTPNTSVEQDVYPLVSARIKSDRYNVHKEYHELYVAKLRDMEYDVIQVAEGIIPLIPAPCDKVNIELTMNSALVNADECFIFVRSFETDAHLTQKSERMRAKHISHARAKALK